MKNNGSLFIQEASMSKLHILNSTWQAIAYTKKSPIKGKQNHDAIGLRKLGDKIYLNISDGMGGLPFSQQASKSVVKDLLKLIESKGIIESIQKSEQKLKKTHEGAGTTLTSARIYRNKLRVYNVGDSGLCVYSKSQKKMIFETRPQNSYSFLNEVLGEEITDHFSIDFLESKKSELLNFLGNEEYNIQAYKPLKLKDDNVIFLGTDGFLEILSESLIKELIEQSMKFDEEILEKIIDKHVSDEHDDTSFIMVFT